jgi:hypothetical protein
VVIGRAGTDANPAEARLPAGRYGGDILVNDLAGPLDDVDVRDAADGQAAR